MAKIDKNITQFKLLMKEYDITFAENSFYDNGKKLLEFIHIFDNVADSRIPGKCIYSTKFIVLVVFLALLGNCETWQEIADFAEYRYDTLSKYIEYPETLPVHDTYMRVFSKINCKTLEDSIINFLIECTKNVVNDNVSHNGFEQIAMDGKALRGSGRKYDTDEKIANQQIMHFWDVSNQLCIRSVTISEKTNEIPVAQQVLSELDIKNKIITSDALNCQKETVNVIVEGKGHYVLALKANHSSFHEDIAKYFDEHILKIMNRKYTHETYMEKVNKLKELVPGISITTDIIVGFPNETEEQFLHTLDLCHEAGFEGAFTFIYSKREGTPAARMTDHTSDEEKKERLNRLIAVTNEGYLKGHERFVGQVVKVLVDGESKNGDGMMCGYSEHNKLTHFKSNDLSLIGKIVNVKVTEAKTWFMIGELCE